MKSEKKNQARKETYEKPRMKNNGKISKIVGTISAPPPPLLA